MSARPQVVAPALLVCVALAACGSSASTAAQSPPSPVTRASSASIGTPAPAAPSATSQASESPTPAAIAQAAAALKQAVNAYSVAYLSGDGDGAFALLSSRCKARLSDAEMRSATVQAKAIYGQLHIETYTVNDLNGDLARVTYTYSVAAIDQTTEPWVREGGQWLEDDC